MAIFVTGSTGYIGAHIVANLLEECGESLNLLVRAKNTEEARERLKGLEAEAIAALHPFGARAGALQEAARFVARRRS